MRTLALILLFAFATIVTISCSSDKKGSATSENMQPLKIEVPEALKGNVEAETFIATSEKAINEWSNSLENIIRENKDLIGKKEEDLSMFDKIKTVKIATEIATSMGTFGVRYTELIEKGNILKENYTQDQQIALETIVNALDKRMSEISEKYKDFGNK